MAVLNLKKREIECKIVFYGPARSGKTTSFNYISQAYKKYIKEKIVSIDTDGDRTLFFDFLPMDLGKIDGFHVRVQLYTVPGQARYKSTRKVVLRGVDGLIFVADSLEVRRKENMLLLKDLQDNLKDFNLNIFKIPLIFQYNKRDLNNGSIPLMPVEKMEQDLNRQLKVPSFTSSAIDGQGVVAVYKECLKKTWLSLKEQLES